MRGASPFAAPNDPVIILSIEAATKAAGAAVVQNGRVLAEEFSDGRFNHSVTLMPMIAAVLERACVRRDQIDVIAVTNGPGSFTGLRIGAATAKGLAHGLQKPVLPIPTLESLAYNLRDTDACLVPMLDARRSQVYGAIVANGSLLLPAGAYAPEALIERLLSAESPLDPQKPIVLLGDASHLYYDMFYKALGDRVQLAPEEKRALHAASTGLLAYQKIIDGQQPIDGSTLEIEYLRRPQAERIRLGEE